MKIVLAHKITDIQHNLETVHNDPDKSLQGEDITITGDTRHESEFLYELERSSGHYGHTIDLEEGTTNLDLYAACHLLESFRFISCEPEIEPTELGEDDLT